MNKPRPCPTIRGEVTEPTDKKRERQPERLR